MAQRERGSTAMTRLLDSRWVLFGLPVAVVAVSAMVILHYSGFIDTVVYQAGAQQLLRDASRLYGVSASNGLPFTYPPFAAMIFLPLAPLSATAAGLVITVVNALCAIRVGMITARLSTVPVPAVGVAVSLLILEPGLHTLGYGQVNLILMWLVFEGILGARGSGQDWRGVLVGFAAGLKLPKVRRRRAPALATLSTVNTSVTTKDPWMTFSMAEDPDRPAWRNELRTVSDPSSMIAVAKASLESKW